MSPGGPLGPVGMLAHVPMALSVPMLVILVGAAVLCCRGWVRLMSGGRGPRVPRWRLHATLAALLALVLAASPPIERATSSSFAAHMVQHLLLVSLAAPLLVVGRAASLAAAGAHDVVPHGWARVARRARPLTAGTPALVAATGVSVVTLWLWHAPTAYVAAVDHGVLHAVEHALLLGTALWFWATALAVRTPAPWALLAVLVAAVTHSLLGGLITFAPRPLYSSYAASGLAEQQLAGLLMWVPGGAVHLVAAVGIVLALLERVRRRTDLHDRALRTTSATPAGAPR